MSNRLTTVALALAVGAVWVSSGWAEDAQQRIEHLVKAAAHLEQAGLSEQAGQIRVLISAEDPTVRLCMLDQKIQDLARLQAEIDQLRQSLSQVPQVMVRVRLLSYQPDKLESMGIPLVSLRQLFDQPAATPVVDETGNLTRFLDMLQQQGLVKQIAEPTLVAIAGREVSFFSGSELPAARARASQAPADGLPTECGTRLRCLPRLDGDKIQLDLDFRHSTLLPVQPRPARETRDDPPTGDEERAQGEPGNERAGETQADSTLGGNRPSDPPTVSAIGLKTRVELSSGETVILGGLRQTTANRPPTDSAMILVLTAERVVPLP